MKRTTEQLEKEIAELKRRVELLESKPPETHFHFHNDPAIPLWQPVWEGYRLPYTTTIGATAPVNANSSQWYVQLPDNYSFRPVQGNGNG